MANKPWQERVNTTRIKSLTERGVKQPKDEVERKAMLEAANERGGIVFNPDEINQESLGDGNV